MTNTDQVQAIHKAYYEHDFDELDRLRETVDPATFMEGLALIEATQPIDHEYRMRRVNGLVYLAQHRPGLSIPDAIADLSDDEMLELHNILEGGTDESP